MKNLFKLLISAIAMIFLSSCSKEEVQPPINYDWFPFPIESIETRTLDIASRKWHYPFFEGTEEELYRSNEYFIARIHGTSEWIHAGHPINKFHYERGYEYTIRGSLISYVVEGDMIFVTFICEEVLSKVRKDSENLPPDELW